MRHPRSVVVPTMKYLGRLSRLAVIFAAFASFAASGLAEDAGDEARLEALIETAKDEEADFDSAYAEAEQAGWPADWLLEARLVRALVQGELENLMALLPEIDEAGDEFRYGIGRTFISEMQLDGFADTLRCVQAYQSDDMEAFVDLAVSSFRKSPEFNKAFGIGDLLSHYHYQQVQESSLADLSVPMDLELSSVEGETKSLKEWMGDKDAALLDFWASWCGPCIRLMPSLKEKSATLSSQGVFVAGVNTDQGDQLGSAKKVRQQHGMESVPWLLDPNGSALSGHLMIDSIPRMILVDREGTILYNGHPSDPALGDALAKVGAKLDH